MTKQRIVNTLAIVALLTSFLFVSSPVFAAVTGTGNIDQYANLPNKGWQNGNLNGSNSAYTEGEVVPFRATLDGIAAGHYDLVIKYGFAQSGAIAYDFLAAYNVTENPDICASGGGAVSPLCAALPAPNDFPMPNNDTYTPPLPSAPTLSVDQAVNNSPSVARFFRMYGGTISALSGITHPTTDEAFITVSFDTDPACLANCSVLLLWGGHIGKSSYWRTSDDLPNGAGAINGSPYHMALVSLNGDSLGSQDRSMKTDALFTELIVMKSLPQGAADGDGGLFNLFVDSVQKATDVGDGGTTGSLAVTGDASHDASETAGTGTDLSLYDTAWDCNDTFGGDVSNGTGTSLSVFVPMGSSITCTFINTPHTTAVTFADASASANFWEVTINWDTALEIDVIGYNVFRSDSLDGAKTQLNSALIPARSFGGIGGASYQFVDHTVQPAHAYFYWIQSDEAGKTSFYPEALQVNVPVGIYLPLVTR